MSGSAGKTLAARLLLVASGILEMRRSWPYCPTRGRDCRWEKSLPAVSANLQLNTSLRIGRKKMWLCPTLI
jgi:hypothetical protein